MKLDADANEETSENSDWMYCSPELHPGVPIEEISALTDLLNDLDMMERQAFGDLINAALVRNVKAADLKARPASVRGLARVLDLQPSTVRRRVAQLVEMGWVRQDGEGVHYTPQAMIWGAPATREVMQKFAGAFRKLGWVDFRLPD